MNTNDSCAVPTGSASSLAQIVEAVRESLANPVHAAHFRRYREIAGLLHLVETMPKGTNEHSRTKAALSRAVDATRNYAKRNGLKPDTYRGVLVEARAVLQAMQ